jgi:hypothetical protein
MECSTKMSLRGYVHNNPKNTDIEKPDLIEFSLVTNKGYQDPVTGVQKPPVLYRCMISLQNKKLANKTKFVKKGVFLSLKGVPSRPFYTTTKEGKIFVSIKLMTQDFDVLTVVDEDEMTMDSRVSKSNFTIANIKEANEEEENIGNY